MTIKLRTGETIMDHTELKISFREWGALFAAWGVLANNLLPHTPVSVASGGRENKHLFNMNVACDVNGCGTVGCIGGTMGLAMNMTPGAARTFVDFCGLSRTPSQYRFSRLFYPKWNGERPFDWGRIDSVHAAEAIWNFLRKGDPDWDSIMPYLPREAVGYTPYKGKVKDHSKLKITFPQWLALIGVRVMLDAGAVDHARDAGSWTGATKFLGDHPGVHAFNMGQTVVAYSCGTVGCIGGYMGTMMFDDNKAADNFVMAHDPQYGIKNSGLGSLFFPTVDGNRNHVNYNKITTAQAVRAIDNFLTTGKPNWEEALAQG